MREFLNSFSKLEFDKIKRHIQRYAISDLGREHLEELTPSSSIPDIERKLSLVSELKKLLESDDPLPLDHVVDIRQSLQRSLIENYILPASDLRAIGLVLDTSSKTILYISKRKDFYPLLFEKIAPIQINKILSYNIHQAIDEEGRVKDNASKELQSIRRQMISKNEVLRKRLQSILKTVAGKEWSQDEIITTREGRMVIPIKTEHKNQVPGLIHSASASGATVFIEPTETLELNNDIRTMQFREQREIEKILKILTDQVRESKESIWLAINILGELDFIQAKAKYSIEIIGSQPLVKDRGEMKLVNARHPILLHRHKFNDVIPLHLSIGDKVKTLIITGPNAGGKSVVMKTVGLLSILAQSGCHIPVSPESEMRLFSDIFVDMGDEQSIENDLSSFSSHLENLKQIVQHANEDSLVLLDEIGSGTDPKEGASIAAAVLQALTDIQCITIATTHHGTLKAFAFETPFFVNGAMEFNQDTLRPTYQYKSGIPGSSFAIEMAKRMKFPQKLLDHAQLLKGSDENKLENLILDLERQSQEFKHNLDAVLKEKETLNRSIQDYKNRISLLEKEIKAIKATAISEAQSIIQKANKTIESAVREIKEKRAERGTVKSAKTNVDEIAKELTRLQREFEHIPDEPPKNFQPNESVRLKGSGAIGEILSKVDDHTYVVVIGGMKIKTKDEDLELAAIKPVVHSEVFNLDEQDTIQREIDLRGMYGDEALVAIDKFLDSCILSGLRKVDIIHGKGTGALRKKVTEYLKNNPAVRSFRLGEWNEGGSGVTVVELN